MNTTFEESWKVLPKQIRLVWINILKMMYYRGYEVKGNEPFCFVTRFDKTRPGCATKDPVAVLCTHTSKIDIDTSRKYIETALQQKVKHVILFYQDNITPSARKQLDACQLYFEYFAYHEFYYCLPEHVLQPRHMVLTEETKKQIFKHVPQDHLPLMYQSTSLARYYNLQPGQVCLFLRERPGQEPHFYIRTCIQG